MTAQTLRPSAINLSVNGTFTNAQMNLYVQSLLNGCNPATEIGANANSTSAITGCVAVPLGTVNNHSSGIEGYANSSADSGSGTHGNAVGGYFVGRTVANNSAAWGVNPICTDAPHPSGAPTGTWCTAGEFDLGIDGTPAFARGITINAGGAGTAPAGSAYLSAHYTSGNFKLVNGFLVDRGATGSGIGILLDGSGFGGSNISQYIAFNGYDAGNVVHQGNVGVDANGNIRLQPSAGTATSISNNAGVATPSVDYTEVASPSGLAGSERCYGDSTAHALKCSYNNGTFLNIPQTIGNGTATMTTAAIGSGACGSTVTVTAAGVLTTDVVEVSANSAVAANPGVLIIQKWPTAGNVNFAYCNPTAGSVTPTATTLNWRVSR